ncbi:hypothetical protein F4695_001699 [Rhizobium soli]|uniref:Uncharacterized protein n=1 Tax=Rhizobium soli TaxID=424798 RepID=A0A7X0JJH9_9HYPH|nr:hypothetical protein [Rhizobium soli]MBB6508350.1 hypothetical protein [Rhizobium soli]
MNGLSPFRGEGPFLFRQNQVMLAHDHPAIDLGLLDTLCIARISNFTIRFLRADGHQ